MLLHAYNQRGLFAFKSKAIKMDSLMNANHSTAVSLQTHCVNPPICKIPPILGFHAFKIFYRKSLVYSPWKDYA